jgi:hypothetical protein
MALLIELHNMPVHTLSKTGRRYSINDYSATSPTRGDAPGNYNLLGWWRADDLGLAGGATVVTWISVVNSIVATSVNSPTYATADIAGKPTVTFPGSAYFNLGSPYLNLTDASTGGNWTIACVCHASVDSEIVGVAGQNLQVRKFRSGTNNISIYTGGSDVQSNTFTSTANQAVICWWVHNSSGNMLWYENKYTRGSTTGYANFPSTHNQIGTSGIGGTMTGGMAELCVWRAALTGVQITSLFDTYFQVRYPGVFYTT